jgi:glutamate racemase
MNLQDNSVQTDCAENHTNMASRISQRQRILVFDSGLGGLSIVAELTSASLDVDIYYLADTAYFPYGEKSDATLIDRVPDIIETVVAQTRANLVIIACNTASTLALEQVRLRVKIPVIGVVPAIKPAAKLTKTGVIGLLATPNTVGRPYTDKLIADFAGGVTVLRHGAMGLAGAVEAMLSGRDLDHNILAASITGLFAQPRGDEIDVVVLACTHYPHVKEQLASLAPIPVAWIDSGAAIARRVIAVLDLTKTVTPQLCTAFTTGGNDSATAAGLARWSFRQVMALP